VAEAVDIVDGGWNIVPEDSPEVVAQSKSPHETEVVDIVDGGWNIVDDLFPEVETEVDLLTVDDLFPEIDLLDVLFREATPDTSLVYLEPESTNVIDIADGPLIISDEDVPDELYLIAPSEESEGDIFHEPDFVLDDLYDTLTRLSVEYRVEATDDSIEVIQPEYRATLQDLYDMITSLQTDGPSEVVELSPLPEAVARTESGGQKAFLLVIRNLESGKYYLQIGVFDGKEALARKLTSLNWVYPYALETSGTVGSPTYKLLVGPVNEGESNALLLRFKRDGFHDAFIRREG
jgi:hypothetical protein